ncbi:C4orf26 isoform 1 [Pan troglodytes]|uniref:Odontogenesis associated phosphoprotein n=2 Tax=Homininae TaxID=207598 RepID=D6RFW7_HUMAN|nr:C4orf26 isoform 1 [Pan troglodytes]
MARRHCFSYWLLVCWLVVTVAEVETGFHHVSQDGLDLLTS